MADGIEAELGHKAGPFSIGVWLAMIGAGVGVAVLIKRKAAPASTTSATSGTVGPGGTAIADGATTLGAQAADQTAAITTNDQWQGIAVQALLSRGADGLAAQQAIATYMQGGALDPGQQTLVSEAIGMLGPPPQGAPVMLPSPSPPALAVPTSTPTPMAPAVASTVPVDIALHVQPPAGETIVGSAKTPSGNGAWYLTDKGGVYTAGDAQYEGSYLGLPASDRQGDSPANPRTFRTIVANGIGYTITSTTGQSYAFPV